MPLLRFSRDKRGYEHTYLVHAANRRGRPTRPRVLYWYRTPPGVKVGRLPFDDEVRRTLESQYPGVTFDWHALQSTPMPPPEPEYWRERRRAERAARQARQLDDEETREPDSPGEARGAEADAPEFPLRIRGGDIAAPPDEAGLATAAPATDGQTPPTAQDVARTESGSPVPTATAAGNVGAPPREKRRRRRGGRRRHVRLATEQGIPAPAQTGPETAPERSEQAAGDTAGPHETDPE